MDATLNDRGIVGLVTQISDASRSAVTLRALANAGCKALVDLFPKSSAVLFERDIAEPVARVVGGANVPRGWRARSIKLSDIPPLDEALQCPDRIIERVIERRRGGSGDGPPARVHTLWAALPDAGGSLHALMLLGRPAADESQLRETAMEIARRLIASSAWSEGSDRTRLLAQIHRAKLEWEHTADALPEIVGLLDSHGSVARISRAVERWKLGSVRDSIGRDLHALLHRGCSDGSCALAGCLDLAARELSRAGHASFEIADPVLGFDLVLSLDAVPRRPQRAVFTVRNVTSLRCAERESKALHQTLEQRVERRTSELLSVNGLLRSEIKRRREAETLLRRSTRELEALSERLMSAQEAERKRIAQDLHDSVGQMLSSIKYSMEQAQLLSRREAPDKAGEVIDVAIQRVRRLMEEVRTIAMNLRPALLDDLGAASAVRSLCRDWQDVYRDIEVETDIAVEDADIPSVLVTTVFRTVQESLNNVARHASARRVLVSVGIEDGVLKVAIRDDGVGFRIEDGEGPYGSGRGLRGLCERAVRTGGRCEVSSAPERGTTVELAWPVAAGQAAHLASNQPN